MPARAGLVARPFLSVCDTSMPLGGDILFKPNPLSRYDLATFVCDAGIFLHSGRRQFVLIMITGYQEFQLDACLDESLVRASQQGDKTAYAVLVERYYRGVFAMCLGVLGNIHDAEDLAQEAMLRGFLKIKRLQKAEQFEAWILQITRNLCIDFIRRRRHVKRLAAENLMQPERRAGENHDLELAIRRLPQELRVPLTMYYFDGKNAKTIAEKLEISHSGACCKLREARKQLHELLTERPNNE